MKYVNFDVNLCICWTYLKLYFLESNEFIKSVTLFFFFFELKLVGELVEIELMIKIRVWFYEIVTLESKFIPP